MPKAPRQVIAHLCYSGIAIEIAVNLYQFIFTDKCILWSQKLEKDEEPMWPDVGIKDPQFAIRNPNSSHRSLDLKRALFQNSLKRCHILDQLL